MNANFRRILNGSLALGLCALASTALADASDSKHVGRSKVYSQLPSDGLEALSTPATIKAIAESPNSAPTEIWSTLEHGEKVECLDCIPYVSKLLFSSDHKTREISAWWLRRRIFGVFGPGEVYSQLLTTIGDQSQSANTRAYAANALGEFLDGAGIAPVATALVSDPSATVRNAAASALVRLNNRGPNGELATSLGDADEGVRLTSLYAVTHINVFGTSTEIASVAKLLGDSSAAVRRRAAETLGTMHVVDSVAGLIAVTSTSTESDAGVRASAAWALGQLASSLTSPADQAAARDAVTAIVNNDNEAQNVRDAAAIALRSL
jgi:HEAT repeat protein